MNRFTNSAAYEMLPKTGTRMWIVYLLAGIAAMLLITLWGMRRTEKVRLRDTILLIAGLLFGGAAVCIYMQGVFIERDSAAVMTEAVQKLRNVIPEKDEQEADTIFDLPGSHSKPEEEASEAENVNVNRALELDSGIYIGILEIPELSLELPVAADCSLSTLKNSPGCYYGSPTSDSFVIGAHNYDSHFGRLHSLSTGTALTFTDIDGNEYQYRITDITEVSPDETEKVCRSEHSLALFTCNYSGARRIVVFCDLYK